MLGVSLYVSNNDLMSLEYSNASNIVKLSKILQIWMVTTEPHRLTWKTIISVIEGEWINNRRLANEIYDYLAKGKFLAYKSIYTQFACSLAIQ